MESNNIPLIEGPIRLAYITSARELAGEGVGTSIREDKDSIGALQNSQMMGTLRYEVSMIIIDDDAAQISPDMLRRLEQANVPIVQIPSSQWASIRGDPQKKAQVKREYEERILEVLRRNHIDILLSDSYTRIFTSTIIGEGRGVFNLNGIPRQAYDGLVLNIHPADTAVNPGITPTADAILRRTLFRRINSSENFTQINQERYYKIPLTQNRVNFHETEVQAVQRMFVQRYQNTQIVEENGLHYLLTPINGERARFSAKTGATLHNVDLGIDTGRRIRVSNSTPVRMQDSEQQLRERNYETKNRVLLTGMMMALNDPKRQKRIQQNRQLNDTLNGARNGICTNGVSHSNGSVHSNIPARVLTSPAQPGR